jgi:hypothetical protein
MQAIVGERFSLSDISDKSSDLAIGLSIGLTPVVINLSLFFLPASAGFPQGK